MSTGSSQILPTSSCTNFIATKWPFVNPVINLGAWSLWRFQNNHNKQGPTKSNSKTMEKPALLEEQEMKAMNFITLRKLEK
jgi:hypothetical protein